MDNAAARAQEVLDFIPLQLSIWYHNLTHNLTHMFDGMNNTRYIRVIAIIGAYFLLRPYVMKLGERMQKKEFEKEVDPHFLAKGGKKAAISPNVLRGFKGQEVPLDEVEEERDDVVPGGKEAGTDGGDGDKANWGKKARKRQRGLAKKVLEEQEKRRLEAEGDEEDKDIMEHLLDYVPGEDGWE